MSHALRSCKCLLHQVRMGGGGDQSYWGTRGGGPREGSESRGRNGLKVLSELSCSLTVCEALGWAHRCGSCYYCLSIEEDIEADRDSAACPRSHTQNDNFKVLPRAAEAWSPGFQLAPTSLSFVSLLALQRPCWPRQMRLQL